MEIKQLALHMFPYWLLGLLMLFLTIKAGYKQLLRIDFIALLKWVGFMIVLNIFRAALLKVTYQESLGHMNKFLMDLPPLFAFTTFWEDACFVLPILLLGVILKDKWYKKPMIAVGSLTLMISFSLGHVYEGGIAACALSLYIPMAFSRAKKYGLGTVILAHSIYDFTTLLSIQWLLRTH